MFPLRLPNCVAGAITSILMDGCPLSPLSGMRMKGLMRKQYAEGDFHFHSVSGCHNETSCSNLPTHAMVLLVVSASRLRRRFVGIPPACMRVGGGQIVPGEKRPSAPGYFSVGPSLHQALSNGWLEQVR